MAEPYRDGRPLDALIEPDRRRQRAFVLVVASMVLGAAVLELGRWMIEPTATPAPILPSPHSVASALGSEGVERVVASHRIGIKRACWDDRPDAPASAQANVFVEVESSGRVVSVVADAGSDTSVARCLEREIRDWTFPGWTGRNQTLTLPFKFVRN